MNAISTNMTQVVKAVKLQRSAPQNNQLSAQRPFVEGMQSDNNVAIEHVNCEESLMREMLYFDRF